MGGMTNAFQSTQIAQLAANDYQNALRIQQQIQAQQQQYGYKPPSGASATTADSFTPSQQTASLGLYNQQTASQTVGLGGGTLKMTGSGSDSSQSISQQALQLEAQKTAVIQQMMAIPGDPDASVTQAQLATLMTQYQAISQQENSLQSEMYYSQNYGGQNPPGMTMPSIPSVPLSNMPSIPSVPLANMPSIDMTSYMSSLPSSTSTGTVDTSAYNNVSNLMNLSSLTAAVQGANSGSSSSSSSGTQNSALIKQAMALEAQKSALIQQMSSTTDQDKITALMTQYQALNTQENALSSQLMGTVSSTGTTAATSSSSASAATTASSSSSTATTKTADAEPEETKVEDATESDHIDPFEPLKEDLAAGAQEIADRQKAVDAQRQTSKNEYAAGDHGLGLEVVNQAWYNLKENVGNTVTVVKTAAKAAVDTVIVAPIRALANVGKAVVQAAGETIKPTVQHIQQGIQEVKDRHVAVEADRQKSKSDYAAGEHGLAKEVVNQGWNNLKENVGNAVTAVKTTAKVAVDVVTAPARFLWNAAKNIFGGK